MVDSNSDAGLEALRSDFPHWCAVRPPSGAAGFLFSRSYLLELHRRELTEDLRRDPPGTVAGQELPFPADELVIGLEIPTGDDILLYRSPDSSFHSGVHDPRQAVYVHWPFGAGLLRRAAALAPADLRSRIRSAVPDPIGVWRERRQLLNALYDGEDIRERWRELQESVLATYGLQDLPVGKVRSIGRLLASHPGYRGRGSRS